MSRWVLSMTDAHALVYHAGGKLDDNCSLVPSTTDALALLYCRRWMDTPHRAPWAMALRDMALGLKITARKRNKIILSLTKSIKIKIVLILIHRNKFSKYKWRE